MRSEPVKAVSVYSSGRAEKNFQVMRSEPVKAVSVYSSGRAEKHFEVLQSEPAKAVSVFSSGRAERNFTVLDGTPSKAVSVFNSKLAENPELPEWFSDTGDNWDVAEPLPKGQKCQELVDGLNAEDGWSQEPCPELSPSRRSR